VIQVYHNKRKGVWYGAAIQDNQVFATYFSTEEADLSYLLGKLQKEVSFQVLEEPNQVLRELINELENIFNGKNQGTYRFKVDIQHLSSYTQKVLECTCLVPIGYVTTYGAIAKVTGGNARSVGRVEGSNPVPLLIPCHRVVRSDLSAGGYGYGKQNKIEILHREERNYEESRELKVYGKKLSIFPAKWIKQKKGSF